MTEMHHKHVHWDTEKVEQMKQSDPAWRGFFDRSAQQMARQIEEAGGWEQFLQEQKKQLSS